MMCETCRERVCYDVCRVCGVCCECGEFTVCCLVCVSVCVLLVTLRIVCLARRAMPLRQLSGHRNSCTREREPKWHSSFLAVHMSKKPCVLVGRRNDCVDQLLLRCVPSLPSFIFQFHLIWATFRARRVTCLVAPLFVTSRNSPGDAQFEPYEDVFVRPSNKS